MSRTFNDEIKKIGIKYLGHNNKSSEVDEMLVVQNKWKIN